MDGGICHPSYRSLPLTSTLGSTVLQADVDSVSLSHLGVLWVFSNVFSTLHLELKHEYSASLCKCGQIDFPFTNRHLGKPLQIRRVHIEFV